MEDEKWCEANKQAHAQTSKQAFERYERFVVQWIEFTCVCASLHIHGPTIVKIISVLVCLLTLYTKSL